MSVRSRRSVLLAGVSAAALLVTAPGAGAATKPSPGWVRVSPPAGIKPSSALFGVSAADATHAWAVGTEGVGKAPRPLILRYTGHRWSRVPLPAVSWTGELRRVAAVSRTDVWASGTDDQGRPRLLRWNGHSWRKATFPGSGDPETVVYTMVTARGHQPWILGRSAAGDTFLLHRTAKGWASVDLPPDPVNTVTINVAADGQFWAAGTESDGYTSTLRLYHYVRGALREVPTGISPAVTPNNVIPGPHGIWLGGAYDEDGSSAVVEWDGKRWHEATFAQPTLGPVSVTDDGHGNPAWALHAQVQVGGSYEPRYLKNVDGRWTAVPSAPDTGAETGSPSISALTVLPGTCVSVAVGDVSTTSGGTVVRIETVTQP